LGLVLFGLGAGGVKPCVSAFGGDQFLLPRQEQHLQKFFSVYYLVMNVASFLATIGAPILREDVRCFGQDTCYPLAFGIPSALLLLSIGYIKRALPLDGGTSDFILFYEKVLRFFFIFDNDGSFESPGVVETLRHIAVEVSAD